MNDLLDLIPAALYARVSSNRQDVDLSVSAQLRGLRDYAEKNGYVVAREYVDEAESGRIADRPQFRKMLDEASKPNSPFHEILVWKFSRFTRKREHAVAFKSMLSPNPPMRSGLGVGTRGEGRGTRRSALDSDKWGRWRPLVGVGGADGGPGQRRWGGVGGTACKGRQSRTGPVRLCGVVE